PCLSHHFSARSNFRKKLRQEKKPSSLRKAGLAPGSQSSSRVNPAGTGRRGFEECVIASGITMVRVHDDIWYIRLNGSSAISGGIAGQNSRGYKSKRLRLTLT